MQVLDANGDALAEGLLTIVLNLNPYTYLGSRSFDLVPGLGLHEPLATVTLPSLSLHRMLPVALKALRSGDVRGLPGAKVHAGLRDLTVTAEPPVGYQADGDHLGVAPRLRIRWAPEALRLVLP